MQYSNPTAEVCSALVARNPGSIGQMVDLGLQEDWSDYMLVE
jgi:hypothetical protein